MKTINETLLRLSKSKFRSSFHLTNKDKDYINKKGLDKIRNHVEDFVRIKLAPSFPFNDGKQTPMSGHPAFKAMHATATCCRTCLYKWYNVPKGVELSKIQQAKIVNLIMAWIEADSNK